MRRRRNGEGNGREEGSVDEAEGNNSFDEDEKQLRNTNDFDSWKGKGRDKGGDDMQER